MSTFRTTVLAALALSLSGCMTVQPPRYDAGFFYQLPAGKWWKRSTDYMGGINHEYVRFAGSYSYKINISGWDDADSDIDALYAQLKRDGWEMDPGLVEIRGGRCARTHSFSIGTLQVDDGPVRRTGDKDVYTLHCGNVSTGQKIRFEVIEESPPDQRTNHAREMANEFFGGIVFGPQASDIVPPTS